MKFPRLHRKGWQRIWVLAAVISTLLVGAAVADVWEHPRAAVNLDLIKLGAGKCAADGESIFTFSYDKCPNLRDVYEQFSTTPSYLRDVYDQLDTSFLAGYRAYLAWRNAKTVGVAAVVLAGWLAFLFFVPWGLLVTGRWVARGFRSGS